MRSLEFIGNIQPENFKVIGFCYLAPSGADLDGVMDFELEYELWDGEIPKEIEDVIIEQAKDKKGRCNHCNAHIAYIYIVKSLKEGTFHTFGSTCGVDLQNFSGAAIANAQELNMKRRKAIKRQGIRNKILTNNPGLEEALKIDNKVIENIAENFRKYDKISEKQIELVFKIQKQVAQWTEVKKDFADVPVGRVKNATLTVSSIKKVIEPGFGYNGSETERYALTLQHETGWKVWGKLDIDKFQTEPQIGQALVISLSVTQSPKDKKFGFFKRATL